MTHLIYLSAAGACVVRQSGKRIELVGEGDAVALLAQLPEQTRARLVIDSADDIYQMQSLPHITGRARRQMLARHVQTLAANQAYASVQWQERSSEGRRDDSYLFAVIHASDWLQAYLSTLQHVHIVSMTSVAILLQHVARGVDRQATALWVTQSLGGVRLSFITRGQLLFTRLLNHDLDVIKEISKTWQYLISHQLLASSVMLPVHYVSGVIRPENLPQVQWVQQADVDYLAALARYPKALNFAAPAMLQAYQRARNQRWIGLSAAGILVSGSLVAGYLYLQNQQLAQQLQMLTHIQKAVAMSVPIADKRAAVDLAQQIRREPEPIADLAWLSKLLMRYSSLNIKHLVWRSGANSVLVIEGEVQVSDAEAAMREVDAFMAELRSGHRVSAVQAQHTPINRDPHTEIHGGAMQDDGSKFILQVSLRAAT
ncbi:MAG: hypothetical protein WC426_13845 [Sulfuriferula sp.]